MRHAAKVDTAQAAIVAELQQCGFRVEVIGQPVDLLVGKTRSHAPDYLPFTRWAILEVKSATASGKLPALDSRQIAQNEFVKSTGTPKVTTLEEALEALKDL